MKVKFHIIILLFDSICFRLFEFYTVCFRKVHTETDTHTQGEKEREEETERHNKGELVMISCVPNCTEMRLTFVPWIKVVEHDINPQE